MSITLGSSRVRFFFSSYIASFMPFGSRRKLLVKEKSDSDRKINEEQHRFHAISTTEYGDVFVPYIGFTAVIPIILTVCYMYAQARIVREESKQRLIFDWKLIMSLLLTGLELFIFAMTTIPPAMIKLSTFFNPPRQSKCLIGDDMPSVDILVTSCKEDTEVVKDTLLAALAIDYPQGRFRVILADDGASSELEGWIAELGQPNLYYTRRNDRTGFKAGNLNHAVMFSKMLPGPPTEFIAAIDADMIVEKQWLRSVAAHIVSEPRTGIVCPSQYFYNVPFHDPLYQANTVCWRGLHMYRDYARMGWNTGSGYILRRRALEEIGGFPTQCLTEDVQTSMLMIARGWKTTFITDPLQHGLVPDSYYGHVKQFTRWNVGGCQLALHFRVYLDGKRTGKIGFWIRLIGFSYAMGDMISSALTTVNLVSLPIRLALGTPLVYFHTSKQMVQLLRLQCAIVFTRWLHELHLSALVGYRASVREWAMSVWMSPYFATSFLRNCVLPSWLGGVTPGFTPTGSIADDLLERSANHRASLPSRLYDTIFKGGMWFHVVIVLTTCGVAVLRSQAILNKYGWEQSRSVECVEELMKYVAWPPLSWLLCVSANLEPILYIIFPPDVPERRELLGRREDSGARYPLESSKALRWNTWAADYSMLYSCAVLYSVILYFKTY